MGVVWIAGGARGIGAATVQAFAAHGARVAFSYQSAHEQAQQLAEQTGTLAICADMTKRDQVTACVEKIHQKLGKIDRFVANCGVSQQKMFADITDADWDFAMDNNLRSAYYGIQAVLPDMLFGRNGSIVTVSSVWGVTGASCESAYAASKAGLIGLTKSLAQELGLSGIRVNCVAPGVIDTAMNANHSAQTMAALADETALGRIGSPSEVARAIVYLSGAQASFVTGQVLGVTGGFMI